MTAPADVWAVEITPTALLCHDVNSRHPVLYLSEQEASEAGESVAWACSREGYPRVVRFRLVRADEPVVSEVETPACGAPIGAGSELPCTSHLGHAGYHLHGMCIGDPAAYREHICLARVPDAEGGRAECSQTVPCLDHGDSYSSGQPAVPPRDDVGELRECVQELAAILRSICVINSRCAGDAPYTLAMQSRDIADRLAAPAALDLLTPENPDEPR